MPLDAKRYITDLFINSRWFYLIGAAVVFFVTSFFFPGVYELAVVFALFCGALTIGDYLLLFVVSGNVRGERTLSPRFSLGDENNIHVSLENRFPYKLRVKLVEQLPEQFQERNFFRRMTLPYMGRQSIDYS